MKTFVIRDPCNWQSLIDFLWSHRQFLLAVRALCVQWTTQFCWVLRWKHIHHWILFVDKWLFIENILICSQRRKKKNIQFWIFPSFFSCCCLSARRFCGHKDFLTTLFMTFYFQPIWNVVLHNLSIYQFIMRLLTNRNETKARLSTAMQSWELFLNRLS